LFLHNRAVTLLPGGSRSRLYRRLALARRVYD
jgi:hypothetical protein